MNIMELTFDFKTKLDLLKTIRHEIKKKRFILDESRDNFGFDNLKLLKKVKNEDEVKGYPLVATKQQSKILKGLRMGIKVMPIETKYEKHEHPGNIEFILLKELTDNIVCKMVSPHIAFFLGTTKAANKSQALKFLNLKRLEVEDLIKNYSYILMSEFVESGSLDTWVYDTYDNDLKISDDLWKCVVFQLVYTLAVLQKRYKLMHNDFHYGNILIDTSIKPGGYFVYQINGKRYYLKNHGVLAKIWDLEFGMTYSDAIPEFYPNKFIVGHYQYDRKTHVARKISGRTESTDSSTVNVPYNYSEVYDLHYFLTSLLDLYISEELFNWILEIYPPELIPKEEKTDARSSRSSSSSSSSSESDSSSNLSSESSSKSRSESDSSSENSSESSSSSSDNTRSESSSESSSESLSDRSDRSDLSSVSDRYLSDGRMKVGIEELFDDLPTPMKLLDNPFFESFTKKPADFVESESIYFNA